MVVARGKSIDWHAGLTVREVLRILDYEYLPVLVRVDDAVVKSKDWGRFLVPDGARIDVQPIVAGS